MPDRRAAKASRLLDPQWHWLANARDRLYAELEPGARIIGAGITVRDSEGATIAYGVSRDGDELTRFILPNDAEAWADDAFADAIDATVREQETPDA